MTDDYVDIDATDERLYDMYVIKCMNDGTTPDLSDYLIWLDENYD